ncbi:MAG: guanylate kinase [Oligoflexia bacterium]|nr:guanylate kinase [Oligoflexia bacterium]
MQNHGVKRRGLLFCLIGPAGGGKTTFCERLLVEYHDSVRLSVSVTTRAPRPGEKEGVSYFFTNQEDFKARVARGEFFEWEEIHGNSYGTLQSVLDAALSSGVDLLLDVDIRGALNFKNRLPKDTIVVFLAPPSSEELLRRVVQRGGASSKEVRTRIETAKREYAKVIELAKSPACIDYFLVNEDKELTYQSVKNILLAERTRLMRLDEAAIQKICAISPDLEKELV